jgi:subtilisin-like proprotein convertase family protein
MPAANYNFVIEQGSDFSIDFIYRDENGSVVDLTGKCVVFQFAFTGDLDTGECSKYILSSQANANYDTDNWSVTANNSGLIRIKLGAELTKNFTRVSAVYDLDVISQTDNLRNIRLSTGIITIVPRNFSNINLTGCPTNLDICVETFSPIVSPTPTPTGETPTPTPSQDTDLCLPFDCLDLDIYSMVYSGDTLVISDFSTASGSITTTTTGVIENIELAINGLYHNYPTDLQLILAPPSGDKILLSSNHKIPNYSSGFSFMFSNKADPTKYLHNAINGDSVNIYNKTDYINYNNETLLYSFDHLFNNSITGVWTLYARDTDPLSSGYISSWKLIITHAAEEE